MSQKRQTIINEKFSFKKIWEKWNLINKRKSQGWSYKEKYVKEDKQYNENKQKKEKKLFSKKF